LTAAQLQEQEHQAKLLAEQKKQLEEATSTLQTNLMTLSKEKELTAAQLAEREELAKKLEEEKHHLEETTVNLKTNLLSLEEHSKLLENEKISTEER
jgi:hypothetical protein